MTEIVDWAADAGSLLYLVTFLLAAGESALLLDFIVPGDVGMVLAGAAGERAHLRLPLLILAAAVGCVVGDSFSFFIGHKWGRGLIERWSFTRRHLSPKLDQAERYFERRGGVAVFVARWVGALRAVVPVIAGSAGMSYPRFVAWSSAAAIVWSTVVVSLGWHFGRDVAEIIDRVGLAISAAVVVAIVGWFVWRRRKKSRQQALTA